MPTTKKKRGPAKGTPKLNPNGHGSKPTRPITKLRRTKGPRATVKLKTHAPRAHALAGSGERLLMCRRLAFQHRMEGYTLRESAMMIAKELDLEKIPNEPNVHQWIMAATTNIVGEFTELAKEWLPVLIGRMEKVTHRYMPMALGRLHVERKIKQNGETVTIIDDQAFIEQLKAADLIRRNVETIAKLLGIGNSHEKNEDPPGGLLGIQLALIQKHETHFHMPGTPLPTDKEVVLTLESGDPELDILDARKVQP